MLGMIAKKLGMSQVQIDGRMVPVTVVEATPNIKVLSNEFGVVLGHGTAKKPSKPLLGQMKGKPAPARMRQFKLDEAGKEALKDTEMIDVSIFAEGDRIKVSGVSKGKGFAGTIKRHNFRSGPSGHGHDHHRQPGSIGDMGRPNVIKGRRMSGHMGAENVTVRNVQIVAIDTASHQLLVKGAVPGRNNGYLYIEKI